MRTSLILSLSTALLCACTGLADPDQELTPGEDSLGPEGDPSDLVDASAASDTRDPRLEPELRLAERRSSIVFPETSAAARTSVARKAQTVFRELYVNRAQKVAFYGPEVDALPAIDALVEQAAQLSDSAFQAELRRIFASQRDAHLTFAFPRPMACHPSELPLTFRDLLDESNNRKVVAVASVDHARLPSVPHLDGSFEQADPLADVQAGDVLLRYDGQPVDAALAELGSQGAGANESGQRATGMAMLAFRAHILTLLPERDSVELAFARADGSEYTVRLPWISVLEPGCLGAPGRALPLDESGDAESLFGKLYRAWQEERSPLNFRADEPSPEPPIQHKDGRMFEARRRTTERGTYAVVRFHSFSSALSITAALDNLKSVLEQLGDTEGLLIDVRGNPGGTAELGEVIVRFFSAQPLTLGGVRFLNSAANRQLVPLKFRGVFETALRDAVASGAEITAPAPLVNADLVNQQFRQVYTKPVLLLTDGLCYSACDIFAANMQDNAAATVVGMDRFTGAGGATTLDTSFVAKALGAASPVPNDAPVMRCAHRQYVRGGLHAGAVLEDSGVEREREAFVTLDEMRKGQGDQGLEARLLDQLAELAGK